MNRRLLTVLGGVLVASCLATTPARAGVNIQIGIPSFFIATTTPVYYQGHATYWYNNSWYYRDRGNWRTYRTEPQYLHDYRGRHESQRHYYGHQQQHRDNGQRH
jgi:hypothetical protein